MRRTARVIYAAILMLALLVSPFSLQLHNTAQAQSMQRNYTPVSEEVRALFENGMSIDEFLARHRGPLPHALQAYADRPVSVVIEMEAPSLAAYIQQTGQQPEQISSLDQQNYTDQLAAQQGAVLSSISGAGGTVISRYTKVYNGILAHVPAGELAGLRALPGVKAVHRAPRFYPSLSNSIPLIKADQVWNLPTPYTGAGMRIAVIDTGVDYTHQSFGGPGTPEAYEENNPDKIEEGTFPTAKVIGGYDFAGTEYDGTNTPKPDPDPLDENGHGTHVASIAAGEAVPDSLIGSGVAPDALIYALKVFGAEGSTEVVIDALEWAMDPNGDGDVSDRVDVVNMSLGGDFSPNEPDDPELIAANNLSAMGVVVVASSGNAGPSSYVTGAPGAASSVISVAASGTGFMTSSYVEVVGSASQAPYKEGSFFNNTGGVDEDIVGPLGYVGSLSGAADDLLCSIDNLDDDALDGMVALIQRGTCDFSLKVNNAEALGAVAVIIFNHAVGGDVLITMGSPTTEVNLPSVFIGNTVGVALSALNGAEATIWANKVQEFPYGAVDAPADFTSQGPRGYDSILKPDVIAPGVEIFAAEAGSGNHGISFSGTSMASPHVAGAAVLIRQAHPDWTPEQVKASLMNTANRLDLPVTIQGAGRIDVLAAVQTDTLLIAEQDLVGLNWGLVEFDVDYSSTRTVQVRNLSAVSKTYNITAALTNADSTGASLTVQSSVTVPAGGSASVPVAVNLVAAEVPLDFNQMEEYFGYVVFTNAANPDDELSLPIYLVPRPYNRLIELSAGTIISPNPGSDPPLQPVVIDLEQRGPQPSNLWPMAAFTVDVNETEVRDAGDLRLIGIDYVPHPQIGDLIVFGINTWGPIHSPLHYFVQHQILLDNDDDGEEDLVLFNYNLGALVGPEPNNDWVVLQLDPDTEMVDLASPFNIFSDYNAAYQEWAILAAWNGLGDTDADPSTEPVSQFTYQAFSADVQGNEDETEPATVDYRNLPFDFTLTSLNPHNTTVRLEAAVTDLDLYEENPPRGVMLVDLFARPGADQALFWPVEILEEGEQPSSFIQFMPVIHAAPAE